MVNCVTSLMGINLLNQIRVYNAFLYQFFYNVCSTRYVHPLKRLAVLYRIYHQHLLLIFILLYNLKFINRLNEKLFKILFFRNSHLNIFLFLYGVLICFIILFYFIQLNINHFLFFHILIIPKLNHANKHRQPPIYIFCYLI